MAHAWLLAVWYHQMIYGSVMEELLDSIKNKQTKTLCPATWDAFPAFQETKWKKQSLKDCGTFCKWVSGLRTALRCITMGNVNLFWNLCLWERSLFWRPSNLMYIKLWILQACQGYAQNSEMVIDGVLIILGIGTTLCVYSMMWNQSNSAVCAPFIDFEKPLWRLKGKFFKDMEGKWHLLHLNVTSVALQWGM